MNDLMDLAIRVARQTLERMYMDSFTLYRWINKVDEDGISSKEKEMITTGVPCTISLRSQGIPNGVDRTTRASYDNTDEVLYCSPDVPIEENDVIEVQGKFYDAGKPYVYPTHQELHITLKEAI